MNGLLEFLLYGVPLLLVALWVVVWIVERARALWLIRSKTAAQDAAEKAALPPFERVKAMIFGTEREKALNLLWPWRKRQKAEPPKVLTPGDTSGLQHNLNLMRDYQDPEKQ